jgi:hypothetical protein
MAKKNKTTETEVNVTDFIHDYVDDEQKKADSFELIKHMTSWSGSEPKMWGPTIIGFGKYHYTYDSGHSGTAPLIGFSPRKTKFSLYVFTPLDKNEKLLQKLGKFTKGKSCIYVKKLSDIDISVLEKLCKATMAHLQEKYDTNS